ncbi:hypothetical protein [Stenotrophomonas sp. 24(2023)]|uniref:hypothetical protein n=1 Tax=Stenotrophomonas sp. 24(2023) TaxID=3068324 RepID=UPI0027E10E3E|nr:hypothetical protein [Stenotrophomonas sp. 24(2023)]WMJ68333.1 hypothetical protein Q9R17_14150 [Stenotrophomonas sp. 24(2023)]
MTPGYLQLDRPFKVGLLSFAITALMSTQALSQEAPKRRAHIDPTRLTSGVSDRDMIARACTKTAIAAISAHAAGELSTVLNEAAKVGKGGSSNNQFFNNLVKAYRLDTSDDFLFASLYDARLNLMWLEQLSGAYSSDKELMFTTYLAARCGATADPISSP